MLDAASLVAPRVNVREGKVKRNEEDEKTSEDPHTSEAKMISGMCKIATEKGKRKKKHRANKTKLTKNHAVGASDISTVQAAHNCESGSAIKFATETVPSASFQSLPPAPPSKNRKPSHSYNTIPPFNCKHYKN